MAMVRIKPKWFMAAMYRILHTGKYPGCRTGPDPQTGNEDYTEPSAYRPLCMLDFTGKLMEQIIAKWLKEYLEANNLISANKYGVREGHSTL